MKKEALTRVCLELIDKEGLINLSLRKVCKQSKISTKSFKTIMGCSFLEFVNTLDKKYLEFIDIEIFKTRLNPSFRKQHILEVCLCLSIEIGYKNITRELISKKAGVSKSTVSHYFSTMKILRALIMQLAVERKILEIIAQGLTNNDCIAKKASKSLKISAGKTIGNY